ncbi:hypothetical protein CROQUDRAFT_50211, partial [Cronartium quercuum f. sp. fusiforme G11]
SVLHELPYWKGIDYHVVDSMHDILLGLLDHHCHQFWCMTNNNDLEQLASHIPKIEHAELEVKPSKLPTSCAETEVHQ